MSIVNEKLFNLAKKKKREIVHVMSRGLPKLALLGLLETMGGSGTKLSRNLK
jgi:hypothetical protein